MHLKFLKIGARMRSNQDGVFGGLSRSVVDSGSLVTVAQLVEQWGSWHKGPGFNSWQNLVIFLSAWIGCAIQALHISRQAVPPEIGEKNPAKGHNPSEGCRWKTAP